MGLAASANRALLAVRRRARIAILATGPGNAGGAAQRYDANTTDDFDLATLSQSVTWPDGPAAVTSRAGSIVVPVEVTDAIMEGVVSIPHGWGHDAAGARMTVAAANPGVNSNLLADEELVDALSGNAVLNGIPVAVAPA